MAVHPTFDFTDAYGYADSNAEGESTAECAEDAEQTNRL